MSKYDIDLERARKWQTRLYLLLGACGILLGLGIVVPLFFVNGTFVEISPKQASQVAELRVTRGPALAIGNKVYSFAGPIGLEITANGYLPAQLEISGENKANFVEVRLSEAPGLLKAATVPASETTNWYLNGKFASFGSSLSVELQSGEYELTVDNRFYEKEVLKVGIRKGQTTNLKFELKPIEGLLKLSSMPSGALVNLNGQPIGSTPNQLQLAGGSYSIELSHPDRKNLSDKIEITSSRRIVERAYKLLFEDAFVSFRL